MKWPLNWMKISQHWLMLDNNQRWRLFISFWAYLSSPFFSNLELFHLSWVVILYNNKRISELSFEPLYSHFSKNQICLGQCSKSFPESKQADIVLVQLSIMHCMEPGQKIPFSRFRETFRTRSHMKYDCWLMNVKSIDNKFDCLYF